MFGELDRTCPEFRDTLRGHRRAFLKVGALGMVGLGMGGLGLADVLRSDARAAAAGRTTSKKSVIILWMRGGPSQHDMWDPKPNAPVEIRGEFAPISTTVPGIQICELLPKCAQVMNLWSIIRSV